MRLLTILLILLTQPTMANLLKVDRFIEAGQVDSAIIYCQQIIDADQDLELVATAEQKLGFIYFQNNQPQTAIKYIKLSGQHYLLLGDNLQVARSFNRLGTVYYTLGKYKQAKLCFEKSSFKSSDINDSIGLLSANMNLGKYYWDQSDYDSAQILFEASLSLAKEIGDIERATRSTDNLIATYNAQKKFNKSLKLLRSLNKEIQDPELLKSIYFNTSEVFTKLNLSDSAASYFDKYAAMQDSLHDVDKYQALAELEALHEVKVAKTESQNRLLLILILLLVLAAIIGAFVFYRQRAKLKRRYERKLALEMLEYQERFRKTIGIEVSELTHEFMAPMVAAAAHNPEQHQHWVEYFKAIDSISRKTYHTHLGTPHWREAFADLQLDLYTKIRIDYTALPEELPSWQQKGIYRLTEELLLNYKQNGARNIEVGFVNASKSIQMVLRGDNSVHKLSSSALVVLEFLHGRHSQFKEGDYNKLAITIPHA